MKQLILISIITFAFIKVFSQTETNIKIANSELKNWGEVCFEFQADQKNIEILSKIISIDKIEKGKITAYANKAEFSRFKELNIEYDIIPHSERNNGEYIMLKLNQLKDKSSKSWDFYPSYQAYVAMMYQFETDYPNLCKIHDIGTTPNGRKILYAKISDNIDSTEIEPRFNYTSTMHGDETVGFVLMLRLIDYLLSNYGTDAEATYLVDNIEIWINPNSNPDGTYYGGNNSVSGAIRYNSNYVDLNRNYPDFDDGPHPDGNAWQPENIIMMDFADSLVFNMSANLHGGSEVVNYPWDTQSQLHPDDDWWQLVSAAYADTAQANGPPGYIDGFNDGITNGYAWYTISGGRQDYMNYYEHCREFTLELSNTKNPNASTLPTFWNSNYRSLINYLTEVLYGVNGTVTDSITGEPLLAEVYISGHDAFNTQVYTKMPHGDYYRLLFEGTYNISYSADGYTTKTITTIITNGQAYLQNVQLVPALPVVSFSSDVTQSCNGIIKFQNLSNTTANSTYLWDFGDGTSSNEESPEHQYFASGSYTVSLTVSNSVGNDILSLSNYITVNLLSAPQISDEYFCETGSSTITASGTGDFYWFESVNSTNPIATGNSFTTPVLYQTTSYFVSESVTPSLQSAGKTDNTGGGSYYSSSSVHYLVFDCYKKVTLETVKVYADGAGNREISLMDSQGNILQSTIIYCPDGENDITLNFEIPEANDLRLVGPPNPNLYRNNSGVSYPYTLSGVIDVKYSSASTNPTAYYYFFYDWKVREESCISERAEVMAIQDFYPESDFSYTQNGSSVDFLSLSAISQDYLWDFGDGSTSTSQNPNHTYTSSGNYDVILTTTTNCGISSDTASLQVITTIQNSIQSYFAQIYPNPSEGKINIQFNSFSMNTRLEVEIFDLSGKSVFKDNYRNSSQNSISVKLKPGVYSVKIQAEKSFSTEKVIVL